jgi:hypothetical protein
MSDHKLPFGCVLFISILFFVGCGADISSTSGTGTSLTLEGTVTDGALRNARVVLATLRQGRISNEVKTDSAGRYTIRVAKTRLLRLDESDLPYIYASSGSDTKVNIGGAEQDLEEGQVSFRSLLSVNQLKTLASEDRTSIDTDVEAVNGESLKDLARNLTVSHVSNAKTLVFESRLLAKGVLKGNKQLTPDSFNSNDTLSDTEITEAINEVEAVETALEDPQSDESANLMLLAAATKEIVEGGGVDLITSSSTTVARSNASALLLELASNRKTLHASFSAKLSSRLAEVKADLGTRLKDSFREEVKQALNEIDEQDTRDAANEDFAVFREILAGSMPKFSDDEMSSVDKSIHLTFSNGNLTRRLVASQSSSGVSTRHLRFEDPGDSLVSLTFSFDTSRPVDLRIITIDQDQFNLPIGKLPIGGEQSGTAGSSVNLQSSTSSVANSPTLASGGSGRFYPLTVKYGSGGLKTLEMVLGATRSGVGRVTPLGIVAIKGLFDTDSWYYLTEANFKGVLFPVVEGSIDEALNEARKESIEGLRAAHQISSSLRNSSNASTKRQANLVYAITNLAIHFNDNVNPERTLTQLLNKLNIAKNERNLFDLMVKLNTGQNGQLDLDDFQGFFEIQNYFASSSDSIVSAINSSLRALAIVEASSSSLDDNAEIMNLNWDSETVSFQKKDLLMLLSSSHALKFVLHYVSSHTFDLSDAALKSLLDDARGSQNQIDTFEEAVEHYSASNVTGTELESIQLIDVLKVDSNFLQLRNSTDLANARSSLLSALDYGLKFIQSIQGLNGGSSDSTFYVMSHELAELKESKKEALSVWNNVSKVYHPSISINGKSGADWYSVEEIPGTTLVLGYESTIRNTTGFDFNYIYNSEQSQFYDWNMGTNPQTHPFEIISFTRADVSALFNRSFRSVILGGSVGLTQALSDEHLLESHISGSQPSSVITALVPGAELIEIGGEKDVLVQMVKATRFVPSTLNYSFNLNQATFFGEHDPVTFISNPVSLPTSNVSVFKAYLTMFPGNLIREETISSQGILSGTVQGLSGSFLRMRIRFVDSSEDRFFWCHGSLNSSSNETVFQSCNEGPVSHHKDVLLAEHNQQ